MMRQQNALEKLEDSGYRLTPGRRRLLDMLSIQQEGMSAESIVAKLPGLGRATVYRNLRLLVHEGLLCKLTFEDGAPRYTLSTRLAHHHHVICVACGSVREFRESMLERVLHGIEGAGRDRVVGHRIEVYVLCSTCQAAGRQPERHAVHVHST